MTDQDARILYEASPAFNQRREIRLLDAQEAKAKRAATVRIRSPLEPWQDRRAIYLREKKLARNPNPRKWNV